MPGHIQHFKPRLLVQYIFLFAVLCRAFVPTTNLHHGVPKSSSFSVSESQISSASHLRLRPFYMAGNGNDDNIDKFDPYRRDDDDEPDDIDDITRELMGGVSMSKDEIKQMRNEVEEQELEELPQEVIDQVADFMMRQKELGNLDEEDLEIIQEVQSKGRFVSKSKVDPSNKDKTGQYDVIPGGDGNMKFLMDSLGLDASGNAPDKDGDGKPTLASLSADIEKVLSTAAFEAEIRDLDDDGQGSTSSSMDINMNTGSGDFQYSTVRVRDEDDMDDLFNDDKFMDLSYEEKVNITVARSEAMVRRRAEQMKQSVLDDVLQLQKRLRDKADEDIRQRRAEIEARGGEGGIIDAALKEAGLPTSADLQAGRDRRDREMGIVRSPSSSSSSSAGFNFAAKSPHARIGTKLQLQSMPPAYSLTVGMLLSNKMAPTIEVGGTTKAKAGVGDGVVGGLMWHLQNLPQLQLQLGKDKDKDKGKGKDKGKDEGGRVLPFNLKLFLYDGERNEVTPYSYSFSYSDGGYSWTPVDGATGAGAVRLPSGASGEGEGEGANNEDGSSSSSSSLGALFGDVDTLVVVPNMPTAIDSDGSQDLTEQPFNALLRLWANSAKAHRSTYEHQYDEWIKKELKNQNGGFDDEEEEDEEGGSYRGLSLVDDSETVANRATRFSLPPYLPPPPLHALLVSQVGTERRDKFPFSVSNFNLKGLFGSSGGIGGTRGDRLGQRLALEECLRLNSGRAYSEKALLPMDWGVVRVGQLYPPTPTPTPTPTASAGDAPTATSTSAGPQVPVLKRSLRVYKGDNGGTDANYRSDGKATDATLLGGVLARLALAPVLPGSVLYQSVTDADADGDGDGGASGDVDVGFETAFFKRTVLGGGNANAAIKGSLGAASGAASGTGGSDGLGVEGLKASSMVAVGRNASLSVVTIYPSKEAETKAATGASYDDVSSSSSSSSLSSLFVTVSDRARATPSAEATPSWLGLPYTSHGGSSGSGSSDVLYTSPEWLCESKGGGNEGAPSASLFGGYTALSIDDELLKCTGPELYRSPIIIAPASASSGSSGDRYADFPLDEDQGQGEGKEGRGSRFYYPYSGLYCRRYLLPSLRKRLDAAYDKEVDESYKRFLNVKNSLAKYSNGAGAGSSEEEVGRMIVDGLTTSSDGKGVDLRLGLGHENLIVWVQQWAQKYDKPGSGLTTPVSVVPVPNGVDLNFRAKSSKMRTSSYSSSSSSYDSDDWGSSKKKSKDDDWPAAKKPPTPTQSTSSAMASAKLSAGNDRASRGGAGEGGVRIRIDSWPYLRCRVYRERPTRKGSQVKMESEKDIVNSLKDSLKRLLSD